MQSFDSIEGSIDGKFLRWKVPSIEHSVDLSVDSLEEYREKKDLQSDPCMDLRQTGYLSHTDVCHNYIGHT